MRSIPSGDLVATSLRKLAFRRDLQELADVDDGVVRISLVHYNTVEEVEKIVGILKEALK